jgi:hypothetical protein
MARRHPRTHVQIDLNGFWDQISPSGKPNGNVPEGFDPGSEIVPSSIRTKLLQAISKKGFWSQIAAGAKFKPEVYSSIPMS